MFQTFEKKERLKVFKESNIDHEYATFVQSFEKFIHCLFVFATIE